LSSKIAMSDTELAMREKEDEYSRAIEEDRIRREQRRARRKELARELECAKAAVRQCVTASHTSYST
jgi:hypothetical protein